MDKIKEKCPYKWVKPDKIVHYKASMDVVLTLDPLFLMYKPLFRRIRAECGLL